MNSLYRILLFVVTVSVFFACSSSKDVSVNGGDGDVFGKVYYRNKVFQKKVKDGRSTGKLLLKPKRGIGDVTGEQQFQLLAYDAYDPSYIDRKFEDLISTFQEGKLSVSKQSGELKRPDMRKTGTWAIQADLKSRDKTGSWGEAIVIGGLSLAFLSLLGLVLVKGVHNRGFLLAGLIFVSLLLFLGILYIIFSASGGIDALLV